MSVKKEMPLDPLLHFFKPHALAVVGASREHLKVGHLILRNIIEHGYAGEIYPINPKVKTLLGRKAYSTVSAVPGPVDLAVIVIPARFVPDAIDDCAAKGVRAAIVISAGFKETGLPGAKLEVEVKLRAAAGGVRIMGPNCLGLIDTRSKLNASFARGMPRFGPMSFFSQSGALCQAILDWAIGEDVGFSRFVSIGNKADVDEVSLLESLADDPHTTVILGYIEGVSHGERFIQAARRITASKPVILAKSGTTQAGARAAASHTGSLTGSEKAFQAACRAAGIIRARTVGELFNFALAFASQPAPRGKRLAVVTNAGGPGIMAADCIENSQATMAAFTEKTVAGLRQDLPSGAGLYNPVDVVGDARADRYALALDRVLADNNVDAGLVLLTPQMMTEVEETARVIVKAAKKSGKPVLTSFMGGVSIRKGAAILQHGSIPNYSYPEHAVGAFEAMCLYRERQQRKHFQPPTLDLDREKAARLITVYREEKRLQLSESEARPILKAYGFPLIPTVLTRTPTEAADAAEKLGFPVVMKISSEDILHKSDIGGVRLGISGREETARIFGEIMANARRFFPQTIPRGILIQPMISGAQEVILGASRDPVFGPVIMFGLGGIYVELLKDVSYRLTPLGLEDSRAMIREIKSFGILSGWRGAPASDIEATADCLTRLSALMVDFPEVLEAEINPLAVFPAGRGAMAIDARIILKED